MEKKVILKPLIKYSGGKYDEYDDFKAEIPDKINNYYEPFFGGGGVFFRLMNEEKISGMSFGNDISKDLILFYNEVTNTDTLRSFKCISDDWEIVKKIGFSIYERIGYIFHSIIMKDKDKEQLSYDCVREVVSEEISKIGGICLNTHCYSIEEFIAKEIISKLNKFYNKNINPEIGTLKITQNCITTAVCQGFYFLVRKMYNDILSGSTDYTDVERCTLWYFIRNTCFGGMFRFSSDGLFNIPYGGLSYNTKCLKCKIDELKRKEMKKTLNKIKFSMSDFKEFMDREYKDDDFIFLDPPYDSDFSEYDNNPFGKEEHKALKEALDRISCKWMLVIRKTPFIEDLYKDYKKIEFKKHYKFQARGTYDAKDSYHFIIKNY